MSEEITMEIRIYLDMKDNENTKRQNFLDTVKAMLREIYCLTYIRKEAGGRGKSMN